MKGDYIMEKILKFLGENSPFYFTTVDGDKPRIRPLGFVMEYEGKLYFGIGKQKQAYAQLQVNPNVEICTTNKDSQWIRIKGVAVMDDRPEVTAKAFEVMPFLTNLYNEKTGNVLGMLYIDQMDAEIADMKGYFEKL